MSTEISQRKRMISAFLKNKTTLIGATIAIIVILIAIFAPLISPFDPLDQNPYIRLVGMSKEHLLGTDDFGRDVLSRIIWGARVSLIIGITSVLFGMIVGTSIGMIAGYFGGKVDSVIMRATDVLMCFPDLILAIAVAAVLGNNLFNLIITIGIVMVPRFVRLSRLLFVIFFLIFLGKFLLLEHSG